MNRKNITYLCIPALGAAILFAALFLGPLNKMSELVSFPERKGHRDNNQPARTNPEYNCGPVALKMIFDHYNIPATVKEIENKIELTGNGTSMLSLKHFAESKGLLAEGWRLTLKDLLQSKFPVILFVNRNHYVVAESLFQDTIFLRDPTLGGYSLPTSNLSRIWEGETLIFNHKD